MHGIYVHIFYKLIMYICICRKDGGTKKKDAEVKHVYVVVAIFRHLVFLLDVEMISQYVSYCLVLQGQDAISSIFQIQHPAGTTI